MLCDRIQDNLSAYIDGEAGPELTAEVDRHLCTCDNCRRLLDELRAVSAMLDSMPQHSAPMTLAEDLQIRLERQMLIEAEGEPAETAPAADRRLAQRRPSAWPRVAAVAACLLLAAGITLLLKFPPGRKAPESAVKLGELESSRIAAVGETVAETKGFHDRLVNGDGITRDKKDGSFGYNNKMRGTESLSATGGGGSAGAAPERGGETQLRYRGEKANEMGDTPTQELYARTPLKAGWLGRETGQRLGKQRGPGAPLPMGDNNLFLVTTDGAAAEKELNVVLEQAGIVEMKRRRETFEPSAVAKAQKYYRNLPAPATVAAGEQVEVITVEANINAKQFAALNYAVVTNGTLVVQDVSEGMFAATAPTQRVMLQVPRETRLRELAGNSIIQDNLEQAAARRTRAHQFQSDLEVDLLQSQPDGGATAAEKDDRSVEVEHAAKTGASFEARTKAEPGEPERRMKERRAGIGEQEAGEAQQKEPVEEKSGDSLIDESAKKPADVGGDVTGTDRTVPSAEETEEQRQSKAKGVQWYATRKPEKDIEEEKEAREAAEPTLQPATGGVAKEPAKKIAEQPTPDDAPAERPPAETGARASPARPATSGPGESVDANEGLARKLSATQERIATSGWAEGEHGQTQFAPAAEDKPTQQGVAREDQAGLTERQVADTVTLLGLQAQREADEALMPIVIQLVARRVRPPDTAAEETEAEESAGKAKTGDVQLSTESEAGPAP